jgi:hypothetical protein
MKTQQRKFVVERKVGRRRLTMQPASIWGDTDLKAFVREVETDAPHLFAHDTVSDTLGQVSEQQPEPVPETHLNEETETADQRPIMASPVEAEKNSPSQQSNVLTLDAAAHLDLDMAVSRSPRTATRRGLRTHSRQVEGTKITPTVRLAAVKVEALGDELIALEDENRRLKGLLAQHFRQQNMQLRTMLARFGVS